MSDSMSRSADPLRSPGEGPRRARPTTPGDPDVGASSGDRRGVNQGPRRLDEGALRALVPRVLAGLVRRGEDFDAAEDALQDALLEALRVWPEHPPRAPRAWLQARA